MISLPFISILSSLYRVAFFLSFASTLTVNPLESTLLPLARSIWWSDILALQGWAVTYGATKRGPNCGEHPIQTLFTVPNVTVYLSEASVPSSLRPPDQWLGPRCRHKMTRKHFANRSPNFTGGSKSAKFGLDSRHQLPLNGSSFETEQYIGNPKHVAEA